MVREGSVSLSLTYRCLSSPCVSLNHLLYTCIIIQNSPFCKNTSHVVLGPIHPVIPPFLDYLCKELSPNMVMFWSSGGIGLQHISLGGGRHNSTPSSGEFPKFKYDFTNINHWANTVAFAITLNPGITLMVSYDANHFLWFQVNPNNAKFLVNFTMSSRWVSWGEECCVWFSRCPPHSLLLFNCQQLRQLPMIQRQKRYHHESSHVH